MSYLNESICTLKDAYIKQVTPKKSCNIDISKKAGYYHFIASVPSYGLSENNYLLSPDAVIQVHMSVPHVEQFIDLLVSIPAEGHQNSFFYVMSEWTRLQGKC